MINWKIQKGILLISFTCILGSISCKSKIIPEEQTLPELPFEHELQAAIDQVLIAYPEHNLGISAAVMVPGHKPWTGVSGYSHQKVPITDEMLFDVGSIQKNFEAALVIKLSEEGLLSLDDPISKYLPTYPNVDENITVRQLLNHTSGIFNVFEHPNFPWVGIDVDYSKEWKLDEVFNTFVLDPYGPPGYAQHYSSTNYLLITEIIEETTGSTVPDELDRYFLKPMKLEHTLVSMGDPPPAPYAVAHPMVDIDRDGILDDLYGIPLTWKVTLTHPVMFSRPQDLVRWMQALYYDGTVLRAGSLGEMLDYPETTLRDPDGGLYGLGVVNFSDILGEQAIGHGGSSLGYSAAALYLPQYNLSVAVLVNTGESPPELASQILSDTWYKFSDVFRMNEDVLP